MSFHTRVKFLLGHIKFSLVSKDLREKVWRKSDEVGLLNKKMKITGKENEKLLSEKRELQREVKELMVETAKEKEELRQQNSLLKSSQKDSKVMEAQLNKEVASENEVLQNEVEKLKAQEAVRVEGYKDKDKLLEEQYKALLLKQDNLKLKRQKLQLEIAYLLEKRQTEQEAVRVEGYKDKDKLLEEQYKALLLKQDNLKLKRQKLQLEIAYLLEKKANGTGS
ncbi:hypothetical protein ACROYT_G014121 [Oculina patagonica]